MSLGPRTNSFDRASMGSQLGLVGLCLLLLYIGSVLAAILPPQILDPRWQLQLVNTLINTSGISLVGLLLVRFAVYVDPSNGRLKQRRDAFAGWACLAVIGFLLLIPVQGYAAWNGWNNANQNRNSRLTSTDQKVKDLKRAITSATTTEQLQQNLQALQAPPLTSAELSNSLPKLQQQLLKNIKRTEDLVKQQYGRNRPGEAWALMQNSLRNMFSALVLSVAFAGLAYRQGIELSLWHETQKILERRLKYHDAQFKKGGLLGQRGYSDRDYLRGLAPKNRKTDGKN